MALKAVRQAMVDAGLCRRTVNQRVARVVRVFRFGVENELVPAAVHQALKAVAGLRSGPVRGQGEPEGQAGPRRARRGGPAATSPASSGRWSSSSG